MAWVHKENMPYDIGIWTFYYMQPLYSISMCQLLSIDIFCLGHFTC